LKSRRKKIEDFAKELIVEIMSETPEGFIYSYLYSENKELIQKVANRLEEFIKEVM